MPALINKTINAPIEHKTYNIKNIVHFIFILHFTTTTTKLNQKSILDFVSFNEHKFLCPFKKYILMLYILFVYNKGDIKEKILYYEANKRISNDFSKKG